MIPERGITVTPPNSPHGLNVVILHCHDKENTVDRPRTKLMSSIPFRSVKFSDISKTEQTSCDQHHSLTDVTELLKWASRNSRSFWKLEKFNCFLI